jgi:hypothetical protein
MEEISEIAFSARQNEENEHHQDIKNKYGTDVSLNFEFSIGDIHTCY